MATKYAESFNRNIKHLATDMKRRMPNDPVVARAHSRIMTAIAADPLYVIDTVGTYLYAYQSQIYSLHSDTTEAFFLNNTYEAELGKGKDKEKTDMVTDLIPKIKQCARGLPPAEKKEYKDIIIELLDDYVEYSAALLE